MKTNPYEVCPVYENENFLLRKVSLGDVEDLLSCYSDPKTFLNYDNCTSDFHYLSVKEMWDCIMFWLLEYRQSKYVRFAIVDKSRARAVGTIEIFRHESGYGILRVDISSDYENETYLTELLTLADNFFEPFGFDEMLTKGFGDSAGRVKALSDSGYAPFAENERWPRQGYFLKHKNR
ncbi:MAG: GNAT family N-acetyltransferase [Oscillospiraceae bacterium]|jgi:RimJ/RimL family protein N-acetyltransferase|nr:GNAT family N-acetyltransferase [Oscillospiraceae bacterium]